MKVNHQELDLSIERLSLEIKLNPQEAELYSNGVTINLDISRAAKASEKGGLKVYFS